MIQKGTIVLTTTHVGLRGLGIIKGVEESDFRAVLAFQSVGGFGVGGAGEACGLGVRVWV